MAINIHYLLTSLFLLSTVQCIQEYCRNVAIVFDSGNLIGIILFQSVHKARYCSKIGGGQSNLPYPLDISPFTQLYMLVIK